MGNEFAAFNSGSTHNVVCLNNRPLNVWLVGDPARIFLFRDGAPRKQPGIAIDAYVKTDLDDLLAEACSH